jgi:hypothetical protein
MPVHPDEHAQLYGRLRTSLLARHFALGRWFRANLLSLWNTLDTSLEASEIVALPPTQQMFTRWRIAVRGRENPLMFGGQLLISLAIEHALGRRDAIEPLRAAVDALVKHYKFYGRFAGYPVRWDAVTSDQWTTDDRGQPLVCGEFLVDSRGRYQYAPDRNDPRWAPLISEGQLRHMTAEDAERLRFLHDDFVARYRFWEPSMDELCSLVAAYFMIGRLVDDDDLRQEVGRQARNLGNYLAEHGYLLVRPGGGFTARGAAGVAPVLEFPFSRALHAITGSWFPARADFKSAMEKAGVWDCLSGPIGWWTAAGVALGVLAPLETVLAPAGLTMLVGTNTPLTGVHLARAWAVHQHRDCFDVSNDDMAKEFAPASMLYEFDAERRFELWMSLCSSHGTGYSCGFPPYLGLTGLDDTYPKTRDSYRAWLATRPTIAGLDPDGEFSKTCFASAVGVVLGSGPAEEARLVELLERRFEELTGSGLASADLPIVDQRADNGDWQASIETFKPAMDYLVAVALAWLHADRRARAGSPVTTAGFPVLPVGVDLPVPAVPAAVMDAARTGGVVLPVRAVQGTRAYVIENGGASLFRPGAIVPRSTEPQVRRTPWPETLLFEEVVTVGATDGDVFSGAVVRPGDVYRIQGSGYVWGGVLLTGPNGPNGWDTITWDASYPLHGGIDPRNGHPFALLGKLNNYFFVGDDNHGQRWDYYQEARLYLRVNTPLPPGGSDAFTARVRVWGDPRSLASVRIVSCVHRGSSDPDRRIDAVGGIDSDGNPWMLGVEEAIAEIDAGVKYFASKEPGSYTKVVVVRGRRGRYLRSLPDRDRKNNLSALGRCR